MRVRFEWDNAKAGFNLKKHSISFEEAKTVFRDLLAYIFDDEWYSIKGKARNYHRTFYKQPSFSCLFY